jgi:hypothetical protein
MRCGCVLTVYLEDCGDLQAWRGKVEERLGRLNEFWGAKTLAEISGETGLCGSAWLSRRRTA